MEVNIKDLHPTQLYLSEKKLQDIQMLYQSKEKYEAKWYNWCDGFNQAAELVLGVENDDKNHSDR